MGKISFKFSLNGLIIDDVDTLRGEIKRFEDAGVTDFNAAIVATEDGAFERTLEFLSSMK